MVPVISLESERAKRANRTGQAIFLYNGKENAVEVKVVNGEMETLELTQPIGEMITSSDGQSALLRKVVLDVELGREAVPVIYKPIYDTMTDRNFPEVFDAKWAEWGTVVFLEHFEGQEVRFGRMDSAEGPTARIKTFSAGFEYTEDMVEYSQTFNVEMLNKAMGEAYNALLNHIHLYPIISFSYTSANQTAASTEYTAEDYLNMGPQLLRRMNIRQTLINGIKATRDSSLKVKRPGSILLIASSREQDIQDALAAITIDATPYSAVQGITQIIMYDGWTIKVGDKTTTYAGVPSNKAYLICPRTNMKELIKHDLLVDASKADLSRLVEEQIVGRARRGVFAGIESSVQEITLPT